MAAEPTSLDEAAKIIARLERRVERERSARAQAESIADRRMRELWLSNQELDQRVAERTAELEMTLEQLEQATTAAAGFFSNLSHEMLTPLNGIVGMLELLKEHAHTDVAQSYVAASLKSTDRLSRLLHRLLDLVEIRAGRLRSEPTPTTIQAVAEEIREVWNIPALQSQKLLTISVLGNRDDEIKVDIERSLQIAGELIDNAVRHAIAGVVGVEVSVDPAADGRSAMLHVSVNDSGPGFQASETNQVLLAMREVDTSPGRRTSGAGVGINLARALARELGGRVAIDSAPGSPTTAHLWLPLR